MNTDMKVDDCVIIGGGPAGLSAALVLGRAGRAVALFDDHRPRNAVSRAAHGYLTRDGVSLSAFRRLAYAEVLRYPSVRHYDAAVSGVSKEADAYAVIEAGRTLRLQARTVIIATGLKEEWPAIEGFAQFYGSSIFNCPYCDGWEQRDKPLFVLAGGQGDLFQFATMVFHWSKDVVVCTNGEDALTAEQCEALQRKGMRVMRQRVAAFAGADGLLAEVRFADGARVARAGGFAMPVCTHAPFGRQLGCELDEWGGIATDAMGRSTVRGVYAAGDAGRAGPSKLIVAAAQGSLCAMAVHADLLAEDG